MADKTVAMEATDLFSLGANFHEQSSSTSEVQDWAQVLSADGDSACESEMNNRTDYSGEYGYCNSSPDIVTDLGTLLTQFGQVANSKAITELSVRFEAGQQAVVSVSGHNHDDNAHTTLDYADVSGAIPASSGFGCPNIWSNSNADASPTSVTVNFTLNHIDREGYDGEHWVGVNRTFRCDVTAEYVGVPVLTTTGWSIDSEDSNDANLEFDTYSITAHRFYDKA